MDKSQSMYLSLCSRTALMLSCEHGNASVVELLVKRGANVLLVDSAGHNAPWYATQGGYTDIKTLLDNAPIVASWDLGDGSDEEGAANGIDMVGFLFCIIISLTLKRGREHQRRKEKEGARDKTEKGEKGEKIYNTLYHWTWNRVVMR